jgi:hypothetical protein
MKKQKLPASISRTEKYRPLLAPERQMMTAQHRRKREQERKRPTRERKAELEKQLQQDAEAMASAFDPDKEKLQELVLRPKKADINVRWSGLL